MGLNDVGLNDVGLEDVGLEDVGMNVGDVEAALRDDGYRWSCPLEVAADDFDAQGHLNNAAIVRHLNDLRIGYVRANLGEVWIEFLRTSGSVVAAREVHVSYESEGFPDESFVGATRVARRDGLAGIIEQQVREVASARLVARAWVVQLLARDGRAVDWPEFYWPLVEATEGRPIPYRARVPRSPWGPPAWSAPEEGSSG